MERPFLNRISVGVSGLVKRSYRGSVVLSW
jgi:hypothetical protein